MNRTKTIIISIVLGISIVLMLSEMVFAATQAADYLCELGVSFYKRGRYEDALTEFKKTLLIEPDNKIALNYINNVFSLPAEQPAEKITQQEPMLESEEKTASRDQAILSALDGYNPAQFQEKSINQASSINQADKSTRGNPGVLNITGEIRLGLGFTSDDTIWKDTNADKIGVPREKNWRYLWGDERHNTYDKKIYDRLTVDVESNYQSPLNGFMEITLDPWTAIGKKSVRVSSTAGGDFVDLDLKYWSPNSMTINEVYRSNKGNIINLKQIKVVEGDTSLMTPSGITDWHTNYNQIPNLRIEREYRPIRKLWFTYKQEDYNLKVFPISDQYEALTSDDPLRLSNNHVYWEESPWLDEYEPSRLFYPDSGLTPIKKGRWIRRLSFFTKDSSDDYPHYLTFLRGASFKSVSDSYSNEITAATPMSLWDDYGNVNSVHLAQRLKIPVNEDLQVGMTNTVKLGVNQGSAEAQNEVSALDLSYSLEKNSAIYAEVAASYTKIEEAAGFSTTYDGAAGKIGFKYDASKEKKEGLYKSGIYAASMNNKFYPALSNYRYTRNDDPTFSRNIYFEDITDADKPLIFGDGMDRARNVIGFNFNTRNFEEKLENDVRYRNVHKDNGKYMESVLRAETTYKTTPRLTTKFLGYYMHLPKTHANLDPNIYTKTMYSLSDYFSEDDTHPQNTSILDGKDPSVGSFGLGAKYDILEELLAIEGFFHRTNDPLDFPRGLLNDNYVTTETIDGQVWDKVVPFLYDQGYFSQPPYYYYNIIRTRLIYTPTDKWEFVFRYTYNQNKYTSGLNDNINHVGIESSYMPSDKWTFWAKYIYSQLIDVYKQNKYKSSDFYEGHHNIFFGAEYKLRKDESFSLLFGEFVGYSNSYQQAYWTLSALDTQHIIRLFYRKKF